MQTLAVTFIVGELKRFACAYDVSPNGYPLTFSFGTSIIELPNTPNTVVDTK